MAGAEPPPVGQVLRHRVVEGIQRMILTGEYAPGSRLPQQRLAKRLGVAQSVVRESLLELRGVGLVEIRDGMGVFVRRVDSNMLLQAHEVRAENSGQCFKDGRIVSDQTYCW